jgi:AcrR family transcriptional regulator
VEEANRIRIVQAAQDLFQTRGYRSVTIQDLADRLGMSKKTIYQYFAGKEEIAVAVVEGLMGRITQTVAQSELDPSDPIVVLRQTVEQVKHHVLKLGPLFLEDIKKYLPDLWLRIEQFRSEKLLFIERFLERAHEEGLTQDISPRLTTLIFMESVRSVVQPDSIAKYGVPMPEVIDTLLNLFWNGIMKRN